MMSTPRHRRRAASTIVSHPAAVVMSARDESFRRKAARAGSRGGQDVGTGFEQARNDGLADALGTAGHQSSAPLKFERSLASADLQLAILSSTRPKVYVSSMGLPGKLPLSRARTVAVPPSREA
jgi:hypothetical protein